MRKKLALLGLLALCAVSTQAEGAPGDAASFTAIVSSATTLFGAVVVLGMSVIGYRAFRKFISKI